MKRFVLLASLLVSGTVFAHDVDPFGFEKQQSTSSLTRAEAIANSKKPAPVSFKIDDQGRSVMAPGTKTRAQVDAERAEALRLGLMSYGEVGPTQATAAQERQITVAGLRAIGQAAND
jgi:hypothetical protein